MAVRSSNWENLASLCCGRHAVTSFLNRKCCKYVTLLSKTSPRWDVEQHVSCQETTCYLATTTDQSCEEYIAATIPTNGADNSNSKRGSLESQSQWFSPHKCWCRPNGINFLSSPISWNIIITCLCGSGSRADDAWDRLSPVMLGEFLERPGEHGYKVEGSTRRSMNDC